MKVPGRFFALFSREAKRESAGGGVREQTKDEGKNGQDGSTTRLAFSAKAKSKKDETRLDKTGGVDDAAMVEPQLVHSSARQQKQPSTPSQPTPRRQLQLLTSKSNTMTL